MDWTRQIDAYCERTDFSFWAEPVNALTNGLYLVGGLWMLWRTRKDGLPFATVLSALLIVIAVGSFLFHTLATAWAGAADSLPIAVFILVYLYAVNSDVLALSRWKAALLTAAFLPYAAVVIPLLQRASFLRVSAFYWTVPILLILYAPAVARRRRETAQGMLLGAALLSLSITLRSLDNTLCDAWPLGTHFAWHMLNSVMLPLMIEVYRRHMLEARGQGG